MKKKKTPGIFKASINDDNCPLSARTEMPNSRRLLLNVCYTMLSRTDTRIKSLALAHQSADSFRSSVDKISKKKERM